MIFVLWLVVNAFAKTTEVSLLVKGRHVDGGVRLVEIAQGANHAYLITSADRTRRRVIPASLFKQLRGELRAWETRIAHEPKPGICASAVIVERAGKKAVGCPAAWKNEHAFRAWIADAEKWTWRI